MIHFSGAIPGFTPLFHHLSDLVPLCVSQPGGLMGGEGRRANLIIARAHAQRLILQVV